MTNETNANSLVDLPKFIQSTRNSGYKGVSFALAELIDNAIEAKASTIDIVIDDARAGDSQIIVRDNGTGMDKNTLKIALQFGGSSRFDSRHGIGRFGMGLPNSSVSQAKRVRVITWTRADNIWSSYLDLDEVPDAGSDCLSVRKIKPKESDFEISTRSGTIVIWSKCDRINFNNRQSLILKIRRQLGRMFRRYISSGLRICLNGEVIVGFDPLFLDSSTNSKGARVYGEPLTYEIDYKGMPKGQKSRVTVRFAELPIKRWHALSNEQKRQAGITKEAGVSILRKGREIDYGWYFMGKKRKENYDDWWRCEIDFQPALDELFGVSNTKQGIRPVELIESILAPDLERVAHELNRRVQRSFLDINTQKFVTPSLMKAKERDSLLEPPRRNHHKNRSIVGGDQSFNIRDSKLTDFIKGLNYRFERHRGVSGSFFTPVLKKNHVVVTLSEDHPFYNRVYSKSRPDTVDREQVILEVLELMILAFARAEVSVNERNIDVTPIREEWSKVLASFLD